MDNNRVDTIIGSFRRWGLLLIAVPAVVVALVVGLSVRNTVIAGYGELVAAGVNTLAAQSYAGEKLSAQKDTAAFGMLSDLVGVRLDEGKLVRVEMYLRDGTVFYSSAEHIIGSVAEADEEAVAAMNGRVTTSIASSWGFENEEDEQEMKLLKVTGPLSIGPSGEPVGWLVAYRPYSAVSRSVRDAVVTVVVTILLGASIAFGMQWWLVASASRAIEEGREQEKRLSARLSSSMSEMERHSLGTLQALAAAVDAKDSYTARHSVNVADIACAIAVRMGMGDELESIERAGLLHDIGKIGVAERVLQKTDLLKAEEYREIQEHSRIGANIVETIPFLHDTVAAVLYHHERWDGRGYPDGLKDEDIPRVARVLAVADAFDAMTSDRPYREGMPLERAIREMRDHSGSQFDPEIVDVLVELIKEGAVRPGRQGSAVAV